MPKRGPLKIYSQKIVDDLGTVWRLEVWPRGCQTQNHWISTYVRMVKGLEGKYRFTIELLNGYPKKVDYSSSTFAPRATLGTPQFVDSQLLPGTENPIDLRFRFTVQPASFEEKILLQQKLLEKMKSQDDRLKGDPVTLTYRVNDFSDLHQYSFLDQTFRDETKNVWNLGISKSRSKNYPDFKIELLKGFPGFYDVQLELTHDDHECAKKLTFQHTFNLTSVALFNMQIRWNQMEEFGFTHFDEDYLEVLVTVCPVHVNLLNVQKYVKCNLIAEANLWTKEKIYYH